jgi:hypothetical protein
MQRNANSPFFLSRKEADTCFGTFNMATPVEALVGPTNHLDLFAVGNDGGVWSNFWGNE